MESLVVRAGHIEFSDDRLHSQVCQIFWSQAKVGRQCEQETGPDRGRLAELLLKSATVEFGRLPVRELPHCWTPEQVRQIPAAMRIASNQMLLNFGRTRSPGRSGHEFEVAGQPRRQNPPQRIGEPDLYVRRSSVLRFIDTPSGSHIGHYVNSAE